MEQHHATIANVLQGSRVRVGRLKGGLGRAERRALLHSLEEGEVDILVATQACLSADVRFNDLALAINKFYDSCRVLGEPPEIERARIALVYAAKTVLKKGLELLGLKAPEKM